MPKQRKPRDVEEEEEEEEEEDFGGPQGNFSFNPVDPEKVLAELPTVVRKRVKVLKKLQKDYQTTKKAFDEELRQLEKKYEALYKPIFARRGDLIKGVSDVTEQEVAESLKLEEEEKKKKEAEKPAETPAAVEATPAAADNSDIKGIPEFWFKALMNSEIAPEMIQPHDEESLKSLIDITTEEFDDGKNEDKSKGFYIDFHFAENAYFNNKVLRKTYYVDNEDESMESFAGCEIDWKADKNLTKKIVIKKQKHKSGKQTRQVKKEEPQDSFYNFFKDLEEPSDEADEEEMEEFENLLDTDFEIAQLIKERLLPHAVEYYLGENNALANMVQGLDLGAGLGGDEDDEEGAAPQGGAAGDKPECKQQ